MSIFFATPMFGGMCTAGFHRSSILMVEELTKAGIPYEWSTPWNESLITRARNNILAEFLSTDYDCLMFIDADIEFKPEDVNKLWNLEVPVAVAAYAMKREDQPLSAWRNGKLVTFEETKPFNVDYAGTGFMMIQRHVFEEMQKAYQDLKMDNGYALFETQIFEGTYLSEDYSFCKRWRDIGGKILLEPTIRLGHWGTKVYTGEKNE